MFVFVMKHDSARLPLACVLWLSFKAFWSFSRWRVESQTPGVCSANVIMQIIQKIYAQIVSKCRSSQLGSGPRKSFYVRLRVFSLQSVQMQIAFIDVLPTGFAWSGDNIHERRGIAFQWVIKSLALGPGQPARCFPINNKIYFVKRHSRQQKASLIE